MNISGVIPQLRRYARALAGDQRSGDAYVAAMLEALISEDVDEAIKANPRVGLFQAFHRIWSHMSIEPPLEDKTSITAERRLEDLSPRMRQAFLLHAMEKFSVAELADIFATSQEAIAQLLEDCEQEINQQLATDVLIIEDEPLIAMDISNIVRSLGHTVAGLAKTRTQAVDIAKEKDFGLILADIRLADDSSGMDAVNDITSVSPKPTIFITAYPERLLTGLRPEPTYLITKPFDPQEVRAMISQVLFMGQVTHAVKAA